MEYIYLVVAIGLIVFMASNSKHLATTQYIAIVVGILVSSFMYSFRRQQRIAFEREEAREFEELKRQASEGDDSDE